MPPAASGSSAPIDSVFRALADPTRRQVLERLGGTPASVSQLAEPFDMALPSFVQHLRTLESCGLVRSQKSGRVRTYTLVPGGLQLAEDWFTRQRALWERRMEQFDEYVLALKENHNDDTPAHPA